MGKKKHKSVYKTGMQTVYTRQGCKKCIQDRDAKSVYKTGMQTHNAERWQRRKTKVCTLHLFHVLDSKWNKCRVLIHLAGCIIRIGPKTKWPPHRIYYASTAYIFAICTFTAIIKAYITLSSVGQGS